MFPNLFLLYGPNTNVGSGSIIYMIESQVRYVGALIKILAECPRAYGRRQARHRAKLQHTIGPAAAEVGVGALRELVHDLGGAIPTNWPGPTFAYRILTRKPRNHDYLFRHVERLQLDGPRRTARGCADDPVAGGV